MRRSSAPHPRPIHETTEAALIALGEASERPSKVWQAYNRARKARAFAEAYGGDPRFTPEVVAALYGHDDVLDSMADAAGVRRGLSDSTLAAIIAALEEPYPLPESSPPEPEPARLECAVCGSTNDDIAERVMGNEVLPPLCLRCAASPAALASIE